MLNEYKQLYKDNADSVLPNWKSIDRNDLCRQYVQNKDILSDVEKNAYISAIIYKFWNLISFTYNKQEGSLIVLSYEDCYELLMESILYVLEKAVWNNKDSSLYNDKKAPEKAISIRMKSISGNEKYLSLFTDKKKINNLSYSLDALQDNSSDGYYLKYDINNIDSIYVKDIINKFIYKSISNYEYFRAFIFDIIYNDSSCISDNTFDIKKLHRICKKLDNDYLIYFFNQYKNFLKAVSFSELSMYLNLLKELTCKDIGYIINTIKQDIINLYNS